MLELAIFRLANILIIGTIIGGIVIGITELIRMIRYSRDAQRQLREQLEFLERRAAERKPPPAPAGDPFIRPGKQPRRSRKKRS